MKKSALTLLVLFLATTLFAQTIPSKKRIDEQVRSGDITAFRVGKKWGAFNHTLNKIVADPVYQLVVAHPYGYLCVDKEKIICASNQGKTLFTTNAPIAGVATLQQSYDTTWCLFTHTEVYTCKNTRISLGNSNWTPDSLVKTNPSQLQKALTLYSVERWNGSVLVNHKKADVPTECYYRLWDNEIRIDSVDENGVLVFPPVKEEINSYVYQVKGCKRVLVSQKGTYHSAGKNRIYHMVVPYITKIDLYDVYDKSLTRILQHTQTNYAFSDDLYKNIIPFENLDKIRLFDSTLKPADNWILFTSNGKTGVFHPFSHAVLVEPEYDELFIFAPTLFTIGLKNRNLVLFSYDFTIQIPANDSSSISIYEVWVGTHEHNETWAHINNKWYKTEYYYDLTEAVGYDTNGRKVHIAGCQIMGDLAAITEYIPGYQSAEPYYRMLPEMDYIRIDSMDANGNLVYPPPVPAIHTSGVYHLVKREWVIPKKYSAVYVSGDLFLAVMLNGTEQTYDIYDKTAMLLSAGITEEKLLSSNEWMSRVTQKTVLQVKLLPQNVYSKHQNVIRSVVVKTTTGYGIFSLDKMKWQLLPTYDYLYIHKLSQSIWAYKNGKTGVLDFSGNVKVPVVHSKLTYNVHENIFEADDSLVYKEYSETRPLSCIPRDLLVITSENYGEYDWYSRYVDYNFLCTASSTDFLLTEYSHYKDVYVYHRMLEDGIRIDSVDQDGNFVAKITNQIDAFYCNIKNKQVQIETDTLALIDAFGQNEIYRGRSGKSYYHYNKKLMTTQSTAPVLRSGLIAFEMTSTRKLRKSTYDELGEPLPYDVDEKYYQIFYNGNQITIPDSLRVYTLLPGKKALVYSVKPVDKNTYVQTHVYLYSFAINKPLSMVCNLVLQDLNVTCTDKTTLIKVTDKKSNEKISTALSDKPGNDTLYSAPNVKVEFYGSARLVKVDNEKETICIQDTEKGELYNNKTQPIHFRALSSGRYYVQLGDNGYLVSGEGKKLHSIPFELVATFSVETYGFSSALLWIKSNGRGQIIDLDGNILVDDVESTGFNIKPQYEYSRNGIYEIVDVTDGSDETLITHVCYKNGWKKIKLEY